MRSISTDTSRGEHTHATKEEASAAGATDQHGNITGVDSTVEMTDGSQVASTDAFFQADLAKQESSNTDSQQIAQVDQALQQDQNQEPQLAQPQDDTTQA